MTEAVCEHSRWSDAHRHPTRFAWLPGSSRYDRMFSGKQVTVARQVPPGCYVEHPSIARVGRKLEDHPHSIKWCLWVDGNFVATIDGVPPTMGSVTAVLEKAERMIRVPEDLKDASLFSFQFNEKLRPFNSTRGKLQQYL